MRWGSPSDGPLPLEVLREAREKIEAAFAPAPDEEIIKALYTLRRMTRGRDGEQRDEEAGELEIHAWVSQLRTYPADVVISCLQDWPKNSSFWPTWHELRGRLEKAASQRRVMLHVTHQMLREAPPQAMRSNASEDTPERRAEVVASALARLAHDTGMKFRSDKRPEDLVQGRVKAGTDEAERKAAKARLEELKAARDEQFTLSPEAMKIFDR